MIKKENGEHGDMVDNQIKEWEKTFMDLKKEWETQLERETPPEKETQLERETPPEKETQPKIFSFLVWKAKGRFEHRRQLTVNTEGVEWFKKGFLSGKWGWKGSLRFDKMKCEQKFNTVEIQEKGESGPSRIIRFDNSIDASKFMKLYDAFIKGSVLGITSESN